jgi:hypothetical protein
MGARLARDDHRASPQFKAGGRTAVTADGEKSPTHAAAGKITS